MPNKHLTRTRLFAVFVTAALAISAAQPSLAQGPQPGGVPIATATPDANPLPTMAAPGAVQVKAEPVASTASVQAVAATTEQVTQCLEYKDGHQVCSLITRPANPPTPKGAQTIKAVYNLQNFHATDTATNWTAHPLTFKPGRSAAGLAPSMPTYYSNGAMNIDIKLIYYVPSYSGGCCSNQQARVNNAIAWLESGSKWLGTGSPAIHYNFTYPITYIFAETPRMANGNGNIGAVQTAAGATCAFIDNNANPVQTWAMATSAGHFPEHATGGARFQNGYETSHGMLSCTKQNVFFGYAYVGESSDGAGNWQPIAAYNMMENHAHYIEWLLWNSARLGFPNIGCNAMNPVGNLPGYNAATDFYAPSGEINGTPDEIYSLFECAAVGLPMGPRNNFMARPTYYNGSWVGVGDAHHPDNIWPGPSDHSYDWYNGWGVWSGANSWWTQNGSLYTAVGCGNWGCTEEGGLVRWMQRIPCRNTTAVDRSGVNYGWAISANHYGWCGLTGGWLAN